MCYFRIISVSKYIFIYNVFNLLGYITSIFVVTLNIILIIISNTSMLNPGPVITQAHGLNVFYQNVQGFINFSTLKDEHPSLNLTSNASAGGLGGRL